MQGALGSHHITIIMSCMLISLEKSKTRLDGVARSYVRIMIETRSKRRSSPPLLDMTRLIIPLHSFKAFFHTFYRTTDSMGPRPFFVRVSVDSVTAEGSQQLDLYPMLAAWAAHLKLPLKFSAERPPVVPLQQGPGGSVMAGIFHRSYDSHDDRGGIWHGLSRRHWTPSSIASAAARS
jgi:hypothetical protein